MEKLRDEIVKRCYTPEHLKDAVAKADHDFIVQDDVCRQLLSLLSKFAITDRYFYLNSAVGPSEREWPEKEWEELEKATMSGEFYELLIGERKFDEVKNRANPYLVATIERFLRAFARLFTRGGLGDVARRYTGDVQACLLIRDQEFGKREYG